MSEDQAVKAVDEIHLALGSNVPKVLLHRILDIERKYAFDTDQVKAVREIEQAVDAILQERGDN
jgi:uncharacterized membrane protein (DUF2068 family)